MARYGGAGPGVRDSAPLRFALDAIQASVFGVDLHPSLEEKAVAVAYAIIREHVFIDGNKKTGTEVLVQLLELNGLTIAATDDEYVAVVEACADGSMSREEYVGWVRAHRMSLPARFPSTGPE